MSIWLSETPMTPEQASEMLDSFFKNCVRDGFVHGFKKHFGKSKYILERHFHSAKIIAEGTALTDFIEAPLPAPLTVSVFYDRLQTRSGVILVGNPPSVGYIMGEDRGTLAQIETKKKRYFIFRDFPSHLLFYVGAVVVDA